MKKELLYYKSVDNRYYAAINNDFEYIAEYNNGKWILENNLSDSLINNSIRVSVEDVLIHTLGSLPIYLFEGLGYSFNEEIKEYNIDTFIDDFIDFASDDYIKRHHNKIQSLMYLASELDEHYNSGYIDYFNANYDQYLLNKDKYNNIEIIKLANDYKIVFNKNIVEYNLRRIPLLTICSNNNSMKTANGFYYEIKYYDIDIANNILLEAAQYYVYEEYKSWDTDFNENDNTDINSLISITKMNLVVKDNRFFGVLINERGFLNDNVYLVNNEINHIHYGDPGDYSGFSDVFYFKKWDKIYCYKACENGALQLNNYRLDIVECNDNDKQMIFDSLIKWGISYQFHCVESNNEYYNGSIIPLLPQNVIILNDKVIGFYAYENVFIIDECITHTISSQKYTNYGYEVITYELIYNNDSTNNALAAFNEIENKSLIKYKNNVEYNIVGNIKAINTNSFYNDTVVRRIIFNDGLEELKDDSIKWCVLLNELILPKTVKKIGNIKFDNCLVYYKGNKRDFNRISNKSIINNLYFYSCDIPKDNDNYWHYVDGIPVIWKNQ